jgi:hypothetical protein
MLEFLGGEEGTSGCGSGSPATIASAAATVPAEQTLDAATDDCVRRDLRGPRVQCPSVAFRDGAGAVGVNFGFGVLVLDHKPPVGTLAGAVPTGGGDGHALDRRHRFPCRHSARQVYAVVIGALGLSDAPTGPAQMWGLGEAGAAERRTGGL